jgi:hypothetical protein
MKTYSNIVHAISDLHLRGFTVWKGVLEQKLE